MPLDRDMEQRVRAAAEARGHDPDEAVAEAEKRMASRAAKGNAPKTGEASRPVADRLLVGFLPFIKVKELRANWLGLPDSIPDDELTCAQYQAKHGGAAAAPAAPESAE
jgi:hypothetical protein